MKKAFRIAIIAMMLLTLFGSFSVTALIEENDYVLYNNKRIPIPLTYKPTDTISKLGVTDADALILKDPTDLFIDVNGNLYIVDTGNARVLKTDLDGNVISVYDGAEAGGFNSPQGVYADSEENVYIADTENNRVVVLDREGNQKQIVTQPDSEYYDGDYTFRPIKLYRDETGQLYVLNKDDYHGFLIFKPNYEFLGYIGSTKLDFDFWSKITSIFATKEQKDRIERRLPPIHSNFTFSGDGTIFTTTTNTAINQIKRYTVMGKNIYPAQFFGENQSDYIMSFMGKNYISPVFSDITANSQGFITALESVSGRIYQYDMDGNLITVFGGTGNSRGRFMNAVSLVEDAKNNIYVLDSRNGIIQKFEPTNFINKTHEALRLYYGGRYDEAVVPVEEIMKIDRNYSIAHICMGKLAIKQGRYEEAMVNYETAKDRAGYTAAFELQRHYVFRKYFIWCVLGGLLIIVLAYLLFRVVKRLSVQGAQRAFRNAECNPLLVGSMVLCDPLGGFQVLKKQRGKGLYRFLPTIAIVLAMIAARIASVYLTHYPVSSMLPNEANLLLEILKILLPFVSITVCMYLVTTIVKGETTLGEQIISAGYCLLPYVLFTVPAALLSRIMGLNDIGILNTITTIIWLWIALLFLLSVGVLNTYSLREVLKNTVIAVFAVMFLWALIGILYMLGLQLWGFVGQVAEQYKNFYF